MTEEHSEKCNMDYSYAKSRKERYRASQGSSPDRLDATRKSLGATHRDDSNDYGFDWLNGEYKGEASRREEYSMSRRDAAEDWDAFGATMRDDIGNRRRDNLGRTMKENLGATRRVDLGATGDTRREDFGASAADGLRVTGGNPYRDSRYGNPEVPHYRHLHDTGNYGASRSNLPASVRVEISYPKVDPYDTAVKERPFSVNGGQETVVEKPRRWTSIAADRDLMQEWHTMFGQIRTKWAPSSGLDDPVTVSKWLDGKSSKYGDRRRRNLRLAIVVAVVAAVVLMAVMVPTLLLTLGEEKEKEVLVQYEYKATIANREYNADMADSNSVAFKNVENEFCNQLDQNAANESITDFTYEGCSLKEIKNGSLIIIYIIVIKTSRSSDQALPTAQQVSTTVGIIVAATNVQNFGVFTIVTVEITIALPTVITGNQNPVKKKVQFNGTCSGTNKERCVTKHSECKDGVCKCPVDRTHDDSSDICTEIDCGDGPIISNGTVTSNGTKYESTLNITCDEGFELHDNTTIYCTTPGSWGDLPLCMHVECPQFITPNNSEVVANTTGRTYTDTIEITCIMGYKIDSNLCTVTCLANRSWSEASVCSVVTCIAFDMPDNATVALYKQQYEYNDNITVVCDKRYKIQGDEIVSCQANESWTDIPTCSPVECVPIDIPNNATIGNQTTDSYRFGDVVQVSCQVGFSLSGVNKVECLSKGNWSEFPNCEIIDCGPYEPSGETYTIESSSTTTYNTSLSVACVDGLELTNASVKTVSCEADGQWNGHIECKIPVSPSFTETSYAFIEDTSVNVICQVTGYPNWKTLLIGKVDDKNGDIVSQMFTISNVTGSVVPATFDNNYTTSYTLNKDGASISLEFDHVTCENEGLYMCAAIVGELGSPVEINNTTTIVNILTDSTTPEITIPDKVYLGREAHVKCTGLIGKGESGQPEGQLLLATSFGDNGSNVTYNGSETSEEVDCYFKASISVPIPTSIITSDLWAQCVICPLHGDDILSEKTDINILTSFVNLEGLQFKIITKENNEFWHFDGVRRKANLYVRWV
ncbi:uncharacterized protein LOC123555982 [Mercenaria mercenaria]|uniref:uncharacterized protein LOC123555982 n=1 Tax=Mercenaria mercenaria TaxID=6596 RepID=UPI00234F7106|nr:uncharacterized protein LOC123555982 [Mercenaria mercenaria]